MTYKNTSLGFILRIHADEELMEELTAFADEHAISGAFFYGLGALKRATIGMYHMNRYEYDFQDFDSPHEITNLTGNIARVNEEAKIHAHITLADSEQRAFGGHVKEAIIEPTCEIVCFSTESLSRTEDPHSKLHLLSLPETRS